MALNETHRLSGWSIFGSPTEGRPAGNAPALEAALPDRRAREAVLAEATRGLSLAPDVDLALLAHTTTGLTGVDLERLCEKAGRLAAAEGASETAMAHFAQALDLLVLAGARPILLDSGERSLAAYHEAGHAIVAWLTPLPGLPATVTILAHAGAGHVRAPLPAGPSRASELAPWLARLDVLLGGPAAEELGAGEISGAGMADWLKAASLAGRIVDRWGPSAVVGPSPAGDDPDAAARLLVERRAAAVRDLLKRVQPSLDALAEELVEEETVEPGRLEALLGPRLQG
jgi:cell division protease FtsH